MTINQSRRKFLSGRTRSRDRADVIGKTGPASAINVASAILHCRPEKRDVVRVALGVLPGVEVHAATDNGRLVVTIEDTPTTSVAETLTRLNNVDGVIAVAMVYQHSEDEEQQR